MRCLGVDTGEKRIGLAISDPLGRVAVPLRVVQRRGRADVDDVLEVARQEDVERIVVGLPLLLDGSQGEQARRALSFGRRLEAAGGPSVVFWDERFSTVAADRLMLEAGLTRKRRAAHRDAAAATILLQDYLDSHPPRAGQAG